MGKQKIQHYPNVTVRCNPFGKTENIRVQITTGYFSNEKVLGEFYVPASTALDKYGFIKPEIVQARAKHDLKITFSHYGGTSTYI
jgi:hypothetical protein